jgi:hypothetical protein
MDTRNAYRLTSDGRLHLWSVKGAADRGHEIKAAVDDDRPRVDPVLVQLMVDIIPSEDYLRISEDYPLDGGNLGHSVSIEARWPGRPKVAEFAPIRLERDDFSFTLVAEPGVEATLFISTRSDEGLIGPPRELHVEFNRVVPLPIKAARVAWRRPVIIDGPATIGEADLDLGEHFGRLRRVPVARGVSYKPVDPATTHLPPCDAPMFVPPLMGESLEGERGVVVHTTMDPSGLGISALGLESVCKRPV